MFYHVRITSKSNRWGEEVKLDLSEDQLRDQFLSPYGNDEPIVVRGKTIPTDDIERISITRTEVDSSKILPAVKAERAASSVITMISDEWYVAYKGEDVTDELIQGPPGYKKPTPTTEVIELPTGSQIFVVHGHDAMLKYELELFLKEIGLDPIVLHRQPDEGQTIIEKFEKHSNVSYAFVLLTPDDVVYLRSEDEKPDDERKKEYQARPNVLFEFGYFVGKLGRNRVCCLYKHGVALPTDVSGLLYKQVTGTIEQIGYELIKELKAVGYNLNI